MYLQKEFSKVLQGSFPGGRPYKSVIENYVEDINCAGEKLIQQKKNENIPLQRNSNGNAFRIHQNSLNLNDRVLSFQKKYYKKWNLYLTLTFQE